MKKLSARWRVTFQAHTIISTAATHTPTLTIGPSPFRPRSSTTVLQKDHLGVELFCGYEAFRARPTRETLCGIYGGPGESRRARRSSDTAEGLLHGTVVIRRAQECRTDGGSARSG